MKEEGKRGRDSSVSMKYYKERLRGKETEGVEVIIV